MASVSFAPFTSRNFSILWTGALVSNVGTWMETVALGYYVAHTTGKASWAGIIAAAGFIPLAIIGPVGAAMSDRLHRGRVLIVTNSFAAVIAATLAVWVGGGKATPGGIAMLAFVAGCVNSFGFPSFQNSLPRMVPPEQLVAAVGLSNAQWNLGRVLGPLAASLAIWIGGIGTALWCNAASFLAVIIGVAVVRLGPSEGEHRRILSALGDGIRFARSNPDMRRMLPLMICTVAIASPFIAFVPQMATVTFHGTASSTSVLVTAQGLGAISAAFSLGGTTAKWGLWRVMAGAIGICSIALVAYGASPHLWIAAVALVAVGFGYGCAFTSFAGVAQQAAGSEMRGRALAVNTFILGSLYPIGTLIQGQVADGVGLKWVTGASGALLLGALVWQLGIRPARSVNR
jgi:MFS family permease